MISYETHPLSFLGILVGFLPGCKFMFSILFATTSTVFLLCNSTSTSTVLRRRNFRGVDEGAGESSESDVSGALFEPTFAREPPLACSAGSAGTNSSDGTSLHSVQTNFIEPSFPEVFLH